jgi:hypothetical protein
MLPMCQLFVLRKVKYDPVTWQATFLTVINDLLTACNSQGQTGPNKNITNIEENNSPLVVASDSVVKCGDYISE